MTNIAVFVSGGGTDLQSVIDAVKNGSLHANIAFVVASKDGIFALERAKSAGIETAVFDKKAFDSLETMYDILTEKLRSRGVEYIVLAGYLTILTPNIVAAFKRRIVNIHPSLIPKHCGKGMYGLKVHESVIKSGDQISGATVHFVDEGADTGEIIAQETVPVESDDTAETLQKRVLELEHKLLPQTLEKLFNKENV